MISSNAPVGLIRRFFGDSNGILWRGGGSLEENRRLRLIFSFKIWRRMFPLLSL